MAKKWGILWAAYAALAVAQAQCPYEVVPRSIQVKKEIDPTKAEGDSLEMLMYMAAYDERHRVVFRGPLAYRDVPRSDIGAHIALTAADLRRPGHTAADVHPISFHFWVFDADAGVMPSENPSGWWSDTYLDDYVIRLSDVPFDATNQEFLTVVENDNIRFAFSIRRGACTP